jgi:hypothetical protein
LIQRREEDAWINYERLKKATYHGLRLDSPNIQKSKGASHRENKCTEFNRKQPNEKGFKYVKRNDAKEYVEGNGHG